MKLNAYFEIRGETENIVHDYQFSIDNQIDEDIDEYESRVHREVDEIFRRIKESKKERKHL